MGQIRKTERGSTLNLGPNLQHNTTNSTLAKSAFSGRFGAPDTHTHTHAATERVIHHGTKIASSGPTVSSRANSVLVLPATGKAEAVGSVNRRQLRAKHLHWLATRWKVLCKVQMELQ